MKKVIFSIVILISATNYAIAETWQCTVTSLGAAPYYSTFGSYTACEIACQSEAIRRATAGHQNVRARCSRIGG